MSTPPPYDPPPGQPPGQGGQPYGPPPGGGDPQRYGPPPHQGGPQQGWPPQGQPPQGPVPGGPQGDSGRYGPPPEKRSGCAMAGGFLGGLAAYLALNFVIALGALGTVDTAVPEAYGLAGGAVLLALLALGGGALCFFKGSQVVKAVGMGLIVGWSAMSIITLGFCTGLNPQLYDGSF